MSDLGLDAVLAPSSCFKQLVIKLVRWGTWKGEESFILCLAAKIKLGEKN